MSQVLVAVTPSAGAAKCHMNFSGTCEQLALRSGNFYLDNDMGVGRIPDLMRKLSALLVFFHAPVPQAGGRPILQSGARR